MGGYTENEVLMECGLQSSKAVAACTVQKGSKVLTSLAVFSV